MALLDKFNISSISKKLNTININNSAANDNPFPCPVLLSNYIFKKRPVKILHNGDIQGGFTKLLCSLIDFSFVRSMCASCYSIISPPAYDPVSLFLLELFRYIDRHQNMDKFLEVLRDEDRSRAYRMYAGLCENIPTKGTFSNFKARLGKLDKHRMCINVLRSNLFEVNPDEGSAMFRCPKIPKDTDARIGVRRDPQNPNRKQKIFGYNLVLSTSVEPDLKLELPVAATNICGNGQEGTIIINNTRQINSHHVCDTKIDIADAKYDIINNYIRLRRNGSIPVIDYNRRNENLTSEALRKRGYDFNGWPFAPCGIVARPNGFDSKHQRHTFCCFKQCLDLKATGIKNIQKNYDIGSCPYVKNKNGFSKHTYIKDNPRLINEVPRGTRRFKLIQQYRSASERVNSVIKEDLKIIDKPIVYNKQRADILAQIAAIVLILYRAFSFIVKISMLFEKYRSFRDPAIEKLLQARHLPKCILSLIQRE